MVLLRITAISWDDGERSRNWKKALQQLKSEAASDPAGNGRQQEQDEMYCGMRIADFQDKLRQQYIEQNTAKMNIAQQEEKAEEIRGGYEQINRDKEQIRLPDAGKSVRIMQPIARELESSRQDEQELESFIEEKQAELDQWKEEETKLTRELEEIRLQASSLDQKNRFDQENLNRLNSETQTLENEQKKYL